MIGSGVERHLTHLSHLISFFQVLTMQIAEPDYHQDLYNNFKLLYICQPGDFMLSAVRHPGMTLYPLLDVLEDNEDGTKIRNGYGTVKVRSNKT